MSRLWMIDWFISGLILKQKNSDEQVCTCIDQDLTPHFGLQVV